MSKTHCDDLAVFGGVPMFSDELHVNRPHAGDLAHFQIRLKTIWQNRWFTNDGPMVREMELRLANYLQVEHCVATSNGTAAMALLVQALGLSGDVIMPSFTFISTAHVLILAGVRPVFCDIDLVSHNLSVEHCKRLVSPATSAVIPTHIWGNACDIEALQTLCGARNIPLIFDAAHAFGSTIRGRPVAGFGTADVFSFHATKIFHTFEGGAITTNDAALADRLRNMRNFGFDGYDKVDMVGTNAKMSEVHAAMGLTNLDEFAHTLRQCSTVFETYQTELASVPGVTPVDSNPDAGSNRYYFPVMLDAGAFGMSRDLLLQVLQAEGVLARRYFYPGCHAAGPNQALYPQAEASLPATVEVCRNILVLPSGPEVSVDDVRRVCGLLRFVATRAGTLNARMFQPRQATDASVSHG